MLRKDITIFNQGDINILVRRKALFQNKVNCSSIGHAIRPGLFFSKYNSFLSLVIDFLHEHALPYLIEES
jgi:hypothetical protein